jgi:hypothetical protein
MPRKYPPEFPTSFSHLRTKRQRIKTKRLRQRIKDEGTRNKEQGTRLKLALVFQKRQSTEGEGGRGVDCGVEER